MGPFELMDLIGTEVNYAVTKTVWRAFNYDPGSRPHSFREKSSPRDASAARPDADFTITGRTCRDQCPTRLGPPPNARAR